MIAVNSLGWIVIAGIAITTLLSIPNVGKVVGCKCIGVSLVTTLSSYLIYEAVMPEEMNIRVDLFFLWPGMVIMTLLGLIRINKLKSARE